VDRPAIGYYRSMVLLIAALIGAVVLSHTAPFPFLLEPFRPARSLWQVKPPPGAPPTIYLTFDDGPSADWTPPLLDALRDTGATGTFFLIDEHITPETESIVRRIAAEGHAIGLHSADRWLMTLEAEDVAATVQQAARRIEVITGREPCRLFRPHAGWRSASLYTGLTKVGYKLAGWSWGMWDWHWWQKPRAGEIASRLARRASAGDVVVIHDGHHEDAHADRRHAAETVRILAPMLEDHGFRFGALCDSTTTSRSAAGDR
jgi:peptidoglycan-N-acetylglucosamine deacetylase